MYLVALMNQLIQDVKAMEKWKLLLQKRNIYGPDLDNNFEFLLTLKKVNKNIQYNHI